MEMEMCPHTATCCCCGSTADLEDVRRRPDVENGPSADDILDSYCPTRLCPTCVGGRCDHTEVA